MTIRSNATGSAFIATERRAQQKYDRNLDEVRDIVDEVMARGAEMVQEAILERGVKETVPNSDGRIGSGKMFDAVGHDSFVNNRDRVVGRAGWLPGTDREKYFGWQESGTLRGGEPAGSPKPPGTPPRGIRPMMAMVDANKWMEAELRSRLGNGSGR